MERPGEVRLVRHNRHCGAIILVFVVKTPALLDNFKQGDKVNFDVIQEDGKLVVTELQPAKS